MLHQLSWYGPRRGQYTLLMSKSTLFTHFQLSIIVLGISASHFLEMTVFISLIGSYAESNKDVVGHLHYLIWGHAGSTCLPNEIIHIFFFLNIFLVWVIKPPFIEIIMLAV